MELLILWLIFAIVGMFIYGGKGFVLGFLLGPIGIIMALVFSSQKQRRRQHAELMALLQEQGAKQ